jgi:hypothetical protein
VLFANGVLYQVGLRSAYGKALVGVIVSFLGALVVATTVADRNLGDLSTRDWVEAVGAAIGSGAAIWLVSNIPGVMGGVAKAVWAAATSGIASYLLATTPDSAQGVNVSSSEWLGIAIVVITATGFVYQEAGPESPPAPRPAVR